MLVNYRKIESQQKQRVEPQILVPLSLPRIGGSFMYIEGIDNKYGQKVSFSFERTHIIQFSKITFSLIPFCVGNKKLLGRFIIQLFLSDKSWSPRHNIPKNDRYSSSSTDWTLVSLNFTVEKYAFRLV